MSTEQTPDTAPVHPNCSHVCSHCRSPVMAWLVWAPIGDEHEYYVFANLTDAQDRADDFDQTDPDHEHAVEALAIRPYPL